MRQLRNFVQVSEWMCTRIYGVNIYTKHSDGKHKG